MAQTDGVKGKVGEYELTVYKLDPLVSLKLFRRLSAVVAPSLAAGVGTLGSLKELLNQRVDVASFGRELFDRIDDALLEDLVRIFGEKTLGPSGWLKDTYRALFMGRLELMFGWLALALRSEYEGVLGNFSAGIDLGGLLSRLRPSASEKDSQTPKS